jgi:hypothetical protein
MEHHTFRWEAETISESQFRVFVRNKYYENKDERQFWHLPCIEMAQYVAENKWYLKKLFKETF